MKNRWINWACLSQFQRLHLTVNTARFLVLPGVHVPHLASRVLGQSLRRLPTGWMALHGYHPLLAGTFVDPARFLVEEIKCPLPVDRQG